MKPTIELLKPIFENHKPMIVVFKHRLEVQTQVCNLETYVSRLIVRNISVQELLAFIHIIIFRQAMHYNTSKILTK